MFEEREEYYMGEKKEKKKLKIINILGSLRNKIK